MHYSVRLKEASMMDLVYEKSEQGKVTSDQLAVGPGRYLMRSRGSYGVSKVVDKVGPSNVVLA